MIATSTFIPPALHQRFYRQGTGEAPLKREPAAAMIARSGRAGEPSDGPHVRLRYPLIEAAFIVADMAPALRRERLVSIVAGCNTER